MNVIFPSYWTIERCWEWVELRDLYRWQYSARVMIRDDGGFYWRHY